MTTAHGPDLAAATHAGPAEGDLRRRLGLVMPSARETAAWTAVILGVLALHFWIGRLLGVPSTQEVLVPALSGIPSWLLVVGVVVLAPLWEEVVFRGLMQSAFGMTRLGAIGAVVAADVVWTIFHLYYQPYDVAGVFALGLVLGAARLRTGSLLLPILLHALVNAISLAVVFPYLA